jgi:L-threonylcarbamoyladenylate synthase
VAQQLDLILDAGPLEGGRGSTVVDVTEEVPRILREGVVSEKEILAIAGSL